MLQRLFILLIGLPLLLAGPMNTLLNTALFAPEKLGACQPLPTQDPVKKCTPVKTCSPCSSNYIGIEIPVTDWFAFNSDIYRHNTPVINHYYLEYNGDIWQPPDIRLGSYNQTHNYHK